MLTNSLFQVLYALMVNKQNNTSQITFQFMGSSVLVLLQQAKKEMIKIGKCLLLVKAHETFVVKLYLMSITSRNIH